MWAARQLTLMNGQRLTEAATTFDFCLPAISGNCRLSKAIQLSEISMPIGHNFRKESKRARAQTQTHGKRGVAWQAICISTNIDRDTNTF